MIDQPVYSITELTRAIKRVLEMSFPEVRLRGELSNFKLHSSGHMYFTLKDSGAEIQGVMFRGLTRYLSFRPENGTAVQVTGKITVFEQRGQYQIVVSQMEPAGVGALYQAFETLKKALSEEGLFDPQYKKRLPDFPGTVGVITSASGAAVRDILQILERRAPQVKIVLRPALVQGPDAAPDLVNALKELNVRPDIDVIILGRGGGSIEDLWPFNEESVARAIHASVVPVISAVGHETDFTIADLVADLRAPTPSAAAELVSPARSDLLDRFTDWQKRALARMESGLLLKWQSLDYTAERIRFMEPSQMIRRHRETLMLQRARMMTIIQNRRERLAARLQGYQDQLSALNPGSILKRGYSIVRSWPEGEIIRAADQIALRDLFTVQTGAGSLTGQRISEATDRKA